MADFASSSRVSRQTMPYALDRISAEDTRILMRKRARWNVVIALSLAAFVVAVFVVSFAHIQSEDGPPTPAQGRTSE